MIVTTQQMQVFEKAAIARGVSAAALMEEAGRGIAEVVRQFEPVAGSLVLYLGKGNNAGDALMAARELQKDGWKVFGRLCHFLVLFFVFILILFFVLFLESINTLNIPFRYPFKIKPVTLD